MSNSTTSFDDPQYVGWTPAPNRRGTINILWSCFSVLFLCSYKCVHLNIPPDDEIHAAWHTFLGIPLWPEWPMLRRALRKLLWMLMIIIAPEIGVYVAVGEFFEARDALRAALGPRRSSPVVETVATNTLPARFDSWITDKQRRKGEDTAPSHKITYKLTMAHAFYANMGGFTTLTIGDEPVRRYKRPFVVGPLLAPSVTLSEYVDFLDKCSLEERRDLFAKSDAEIRALGRSDGLTKTLALVQVLYLALDCFSRTAQGLPISLLELSTVAYIAAATVMYGLWWDKPYDADLVTMLLVEAETPRAQDHASSQEEPPQEEPPRQDGQGLEQQHSHPTWASNSQDQEETSAARDSATEPSQPKDPIHDDVIGSLTMITIATIFGAIHLAAWNWRFSSDVARWIWRIAAVITTAGPLLLLSSSILAKNDLNVLGRRSHKYLDVLEDYQNYFNIATMVGYVVARGCIIGITFYSLSSMPASVYDTVSWTTYLPFIQ